MVPATFAASPSRLVLRQLGGVGSVFGIEAAGRVGAQLALLVLARRLGPAEYGELVVAVTVFSLGVLVADGGIGEAAAQRLSAVPRSATELRTYASARMALALGVVLLAIAAAIPLLAVGSTWAVIPVLLLGVLPYSVLQNAVTANRVGEHFVPAAAANATGVVLISLGAALASAVTDTAVGVAWGSGLALALAATAWANRDGAHAPRPAPMAVLPCIVRGAPFLATALAVAVYSRGDRVVMAVVLGSEATGLYGAAYTVVFGAGLLGAVVYAVSLPGLLRARTDPDRWVAMVRRGTSALWMVALPLMATLILLRDTLVAVLFGRHFAGAADVLGTLSLLVPFYLLNPFLGACLIASRREGVLARIAVLNAAVAVVVYPVAASAFGLQGVAVGSVAVELLGHGCLLFFVRDARSAAGPRAGASFSARL